MVRARMGQTEIVFLFKNRRCIFLIKYLKDTAYRAALHSCCSGQQRHSVPCNRASELVMNDTHKHTETLTNIYYRLFLIVTER